MYGHERILVALILDPGNHTLCREMSSRPAVSRGASPTLTMFLSAPRTDGSQREHNFRRYWLPRSALAQLAKAGPAARDEHGEDYDVGQ